MPRFLRLQNKMIHIPSVSSVSMGTTCMGRPQISFSYHSEKSVTSISYKKWEDCEHDFNRVKVALSEVENLLKKVRLTETGAFLNDIDTPLPPIRLEPDVVVELKKELAQMNDIVLVNETSNTTSSEATK